MSIKRTAVWLSSEGHEPKADHKCVVCRGAVPAGQAHMMVVSRDDGREDKRLSKAHVCNDCLATMGVHGICPFPLPSRRKW